MRYANIKKTSQDEKQNQTTTTNVSCPFCKTKLNNKVKIASDKTKTKENNLQFNRKDMGPVQNKAW